MVDLAVDSLINGCPTIACNDGNFCFEVSQNDPLEVENIKYIDRVTHRVINPFQNPQDCEEPNVLFVNNPDNDYRAKYKKRAECVDSDFTLSCKITDDC